MKLRIVEKIKEMEELRTKSSVINDRLFVKVQKSTGKQLAYVLEKCISEINKYGIEEYKTVNQCQAIVNLCGNMRTAEEANAILALFDSKEMYCPDAKTKCNVGIRFGVGNNGKATLGYVKYRPEKESETLEMDYLSNFRTNLYYKDVLTIPKVQDLAYKIDIYKEHFADLIDSLL